MVHPRQFTKLMHDTARQLEDATQVGVYEAAFKVAFAVNKTIAVDTGGDRILSGTAKRGRAAKPFHAKVERLPSKTAPAAIVKTSAPGLTAMLERGTRAHYVGAGRNSNIASSVATGGLVNVRNLRKGRTRTSAVKPQRMFLKGLGIWRTGPFFVGQGPAKRTFSRGVESVEVAQVVHTEIRKATRLL